MNYEEYNSHYIQYHDGSDADYDNMYKNYKKFVARVITDPLDVPILDIGCGTGLFVNSLIKCGFENVHGIDISESQVKVALSRDLPCEFVESTISFLQSKPENYSYIFLLDVIEHIPVVDQIMFIKACRVALKPNGKLIILTPNANSTFATRYRYIDPTHTCMFTDDSLYSLYSMSGFSKCEVKSHFDGRLPIWFPRPNLQGVLFPIFYLIRRIESIAYFGYQKGAALPLTTNLIAIGRK